MSEFQLELKQIVDYPRCRMYRQFMQMLMSERRIRSGGTSRLYHYTVLCSYANFRTSYKRIDGISYTIRPGEWLCRIDELTDWFRTKYQHQAVGILKDLQNRNLITYSVLGRGKLIKYSINGWNRSNRVLDYNAPCQKDTGFFFLPKATANELIGSGRCSEMDALLDLWINTVYNDKQVKGSETGPVVYLRNGTGNPLLGYAELAERWGVSKATVGRYLKKLCEMDLIKTVSFPGTHGSAIYLCRYLSTMFEISDILVDKEEVAVALNIKINLPEEIGSDCELSGEIIVSNNLSGVSKTDIAEIIKKVAKILSAQGFACGFCHKVKYKLLPLLTDCRDGYFSPPNIRQSPGHRFLLVIQCENQELFKFEIKLYKGEHYEKE